MNVGATFLDQVLMVSKTTNGHEGLGYKGESSHTNILVIVNTRAQGSVWN